MTKKNSGSSNTCVKTVDFICVKQISMDIILSETGHYQ